jgi:hypothetical protein
MAQQAGELSGAVAVFRITDAGLSAPHVVLPQIELLRPAPPVDTLPHTTSRKASPVMTPNRDRVIADATGTADWQTF